jgi:hypothetical protein
VDRIVEGDLGWDVPLRLLGALHYLVLEGKAAWDDVDAALDEHADFLCRFVAEQDVQTNEVQRSWALVPAFLWLWDGRPFDLLELGPSAGLNLVWDGYRHIHATGAFGPAAAPLTLTGEDRPAPPADLFERPATVARRRGIDRNPIDVTTDDGARLLQCFVWADQTERLERLRRAIEAVRSRPPELIRGDYVERVADVLDERVEGARTVVFQTASTQYLRREELARLDEALEYAGAEEQLVYLTGANASDGYSLDAVAYPGRRSEHLATFDFHGAWFRWER